MHRSNNKLVLVCINNWVFAPLGEEKMMDSLGPIATFSAPLSRGVHFTRGEVGLLSLVLDCDGKIMYIYKSTELWRGPESIYTLKQGLCVAHNRLC
jgi:hypothetical protein